MSIRTSDFISNWSVGEDSFAKDVPNAVLVVDDLEWQDTVIIELLNPVYDSTNGILKYEVIANNDTAIDLPSEFGRSTFVMDEIHTVMKYPIGNWVMLEYAY